VSHWSSNKNGICNAFRTGLGLESGSVGWGYPNMKRVSKEKIGVITEKTVTRLGQTTVSQSFSSSSLTQVNSYPVDVELSLDYFTSGSYDAFEDVSSFIDWTHSDAGLLMFKSCSLAPTYREESVKRIPQIFGANYCDRAQASLTFRGRSERSETVGYVEHVVISGSITIPGGIVTSSSFQVDLT
jgi:hypothetical protein